MTYVKKRYSLPLVVFYILTALALIFLIDTFVTESNLAEINRSLAEDFLLFFFIGALWGLSVSLFEGFLTYVYPRVVDISLKKREIQKLIRRYNRVYGIDPRKDDDFFEVDIDDKQ